jgi:hypothetical protein
MAAPDTSPRILPLANIFAILALIGSIAFYLAPLTSSRPSVEPGQGGGGWGDQNVDARLWEDPLPICGKHFEQLGRDQAGPGDRPQPSSAAEVIRERVKETPSNCNGTQECSPVILAVMVPGGPYAEQVERRLRTRHAVVEGLSASHFTPRDYLHLGCFPVAWPPDATGALDAPTQEPQLLVPYEWYQGPTGAAMVVLWLRGDAFAEKPLSRLASLLTWLRTSGSAADRVVRDLPVAIIGPVTSNDLAAMWHDTVPPAVMGGLMHGEMYSPFASASETQLRPATANATLAEHIAYELPGFHFKRTILTDDVLMKALNEEVQRRLRSPGGRIVLLAELDTVYGRALPTAFGETLPDQTRRIETFFYPAGLDGRVPSDQKEEGAAAPKPASAQPGGDRPKEATEGLDQSDYLRRLAVTLQREDADARWRNTVGIEAVGVLGADVFDKIMILRALRPSLPDAVFFTNTIDVRLGHPNEWDATHNLVVASSFGLEPVSSDPTASYPPFRDSYEASVFSATLQAMTHQAVAPQVHLYEIGLGGPFRLDDLTRPDLLGWLAPRTGLLGMTIFLVVAFGYWARVRLASDEADAGRLRLASWVLEPPVLALVGVLTVVVLLVTAEQVSPGGEPFAAFDGISIWPSEVLRVLVVVLAVHFIARSIAQIGASNEELTARYHLTDVAGPRCGDGIDVVGAWNVQVLEGSFWARVKRIALPAIAYLIIVGLLTVLLGAPSTPARGAFAWWANIVITFFAVLAIIFVLFFVNDAMVLNRRFIRHLMTDGTNWPPALLAEYRAAGATDREAVDGPLAEWLDIKFIADRTAVIEPLIYYPFVLLAVMILSRLHYFDDWDLPLSLLAFFGINTVGAVFAAVTLRQSAEFARRNALEKLRKWLFDATITKADSQAAPQGRAARLAAAAQQAIDEIESIRTGAFGPLTENPIIGALLLPGGAGLIAAAQHLLFAH